MSDLLERLAARADLARRVGVVYFAQPFPVRAALSGLAGECDEVAAELRAARAENERLREALRTIRDIRHDGSSGDMRYAARVAREALAASAASEGARVEMAPPMPRPRESTQKRGPAGEEYE